MTQRPSFGTKARAEIFATHGGICHICNGRIQAAERWEVEHVIAREISGDDGPTNLRPAHAKCHKAKTAQDAGIIAKAKRRAAKHSGAFRPSGARVQGSRGTPFRKRMDGTVERRQ